MSKRRKIVRWGVLAALVLGAAAWAWQSGAYRQVLSWGSAKGPGEDPLRYRSVVRGPMTIGVTEGGSLRAVKNYAITSSLRGTAKISWLIAEGAQVKKGDKLAEFETKPTLDQTNIRQGDLEQADRQLVVAEENLRIEVSNGKSLVAAAQTRLDDTKEALKRFTQLDAPKRFKDMEDRALAARKTHDDAAKALADAQSQLDEGMFVDDAAKAGLEKQVSSGQESVRMALKTITSLGVEQKLYKGYDYPRDLDARRQAVNNAELELAKTQVAAKSQLLQKEAEVGRVKDQIKRITRDVDELKGEIERSILKAPVDGMVLYGDAGGGGGMMVYYGRGPAETKVGAEAYPGQVVMTIPDLSAFEIDISIGEEYRGKLRPGCRASVTVEAVPGLVIEGNLAAISNLAQARSYWDPASPKAFKGVIQLSNSDPRMVSGMSARVMIIAEVLQDVLMVPLETVFNEDGKPFCCVRAGEKYVKRYVRPGQSNDDFVQILGGLEEGESVCRFKPKELEAGEKAPPDVPTSAPASMPSSGPTSRPCSGPASRPCTMPASGPCPMPASAPGAMPLPARQGGARRSLVRGEGHVRPPASRPSSAPTTKPSSIPASRPSSAPG